MSSVTDQKPDALSLREGVLEVAGLLSLRYGGRLEGSHIGWRLVGDPSAPVLVVLGGISAHRHVMTDRSNPSQVGWWSEVVGPGLALPAEKFRVLSFDYLGGSGETTGPSNGQAFPSISTYDQADVLLRVLDHFGIRSLAGIVGASYGGMVALAFAERYPQRVAKLVIMSAADRTSPMSTAWRSIQRRVVKFGIETGHPQRGLELARALAMTTYRSAEEFATRFSAPPRSSPEGFVFPVEDYLLARGSDYAQRYQPDSFLTLSESIDLHEVDVSRIEIPVTAIAVREDRLVPIEDMRAMCLKLPNARLHEISSLFGHDAFLKEAKILSNLFSTELLS